MSYRTFTFFCSAIHTGCRKSARHETSSDAYRRTKNNTQNFRRNYPQKSFRSSKKSIVSVTSKGKLTAKKAGQCKITATIQWKPKKSFRKFFKKKLYCQVTVQNKKESSLTFRSNRLLMEHFLKHGAEFPYSSAAEYLRGANRVIKDQNALHKAEAEDGDDVYYLAAANEIVFVSTDGYIRTYFKPNDGIDYSTAPSINPDFSELPKA